MSLDLSASFFPCSCDMSVIIAEVLFTKFLNGNNVPMVTGDKDMEFLKYTHVSAPNQHLFHIPLLLIVWNLMSSVKSNVFDLSTDLDIESARQKEERAAAEYIEERLGRQATDGRIWKVQPKDKCAGDLLSIAYMPMYQSSPLVDGYT